MEILIQKLIEAGKVPATFSENIDELTVIIANSLEKHTEQYEITLGLRKPPEQPSTRKLYAVHYIVEESECNPESVNGRLINFGVEATDVVDAVTYFVNNVLEKGTSVDIRKVELEQTFETAEDLSDDVVQSVE